jgi:hypothetical protein
MRLPRPLPPTHHRIPSVGCSSRWAKRRRTPYLNNDERVSARLLSGRQLDLRFTGDFISRAKPLKTTWPRPGLSLRWVGRPEWRPTTFTAVFAWSLLRRRAGGYRAAVRNEPWRCCEPPGAPLLRSVSRWGTRVQVLSARLLPPVTECHRQRSRDQVVLFRRGH